MGPRDPIPAGPDDPHSEVLAGISPANRDLVPDTGPMDADGLEPPEEAAGEPGDGRTGGPVDGAGSRPWWRDQVLARMALVGGLAGVVALLGVLFQHPVLVRQTNRPASPAPLAPLAPTPEASPAPAPPPFSFRLVRTTYVGLSKRGGKVAARRAARRIHDLLDGFYRLAFFDPGAWAGHTPGRAWRAFAPETVRRARRDARALTLGRVRGLRFLRPNGGRLYVRVLLDPSLRPQSAVALVKLHATGALVDGRGVRVSADPLFVLRPSGRRWVIVGYPKAKTVLDVLSPPATPSPTPPASSSPPVSASPSAGPTASGSPS